MYPDTPQRHTPSSTGVAEQIPVTPHEQRERAKRAENNKLFETAMAEEQKEQKAALLEVDREMEEEHIMKWKVKQDLTQRQLDIELR
jgi:hypothetical protein